MLVPVDFVTVDGTLEEVVEGAVRVVAAGAKGLADGRESGTIVAEIADLGKGEQKGGK